MSSEVEWNGETVKCGLEAKIKLRKEIIKKVICLQFILLVNNKLFFPFFLLGNSYYYFLEYNND